MERYIYRDPSRQSDDHALPDVEIIYMTPERLKGLSYDTADTGWYWASGFPGCLWDSDPIGPFPTEQEAINDARDCD